MHVIQNITEINKENLNKPADSDQIYYSELNEWFTTNAFRSFSIKYVLQGSIYYKLENREYKVSKNNYLLASRQPDVIACFNSKELVKSVCIDICEKTIGDVLTTLRNEQKNEITDYNHEYLKHPNFYETIYSTSETIFGRQLSKLAVLLNEVPCSTQPVSVERDWFLEIVEGIVTTEMTNQKLLLNLQALKPSTKKETLKRILLGKEYMDLFFLKNPDIKTVARESNMSEYHFFRCFKQVFGYSPYQYILTKRLEYARMLLNERNLTISKIAVECSFHDLFTFSKAFKKKYGFSPSKCVYNNEMEIC